MCQLQIRKSVHLKYENPAFLIKKSVSFSNTKNTFFKYENKLISNTTMCLFQAREWAISKYEKRTIFKYENYVSFKYENAFISNTKMCHF